MMADEATTPVVAPEIVETPAVVTPEAVVETPEVEEKPDEDDGSGEETSEDEDLHGKKPRGKSAEARINELTRQFRQEQRRADALERLVTVSTQNPPQDGAEKPQLEKFDTYDAYVEALTDWKVDQRLQSRASEGASKAADSIRTASWEAKVEAVSASIPDYATIVGTSEVPIADHVADALMDSAKGPEVAYHMAQHPEIADRLNKMTPVKAAIEIGRLETQLATPVVRAPSKAPAPGSPLRTGSPATAPNLASADMDTYIAERRKQGARF